MPQDGIKKTNMKTSLLVAATCLLGTAASLTGYAAIIIISPSIAQPVNVTTYDARWDFSANRNPSGVWRYGWSEGLGGGLVLFTRNSQPAVNGGVEYGWDDPNNSAGFTPSVAVNTGGDFTDGNVTLSAGALILHPCGPDGQAYAHVVWTAPKKGTYFLNASFFTQQNGLNVDVHVLVNRVSVFDGVITQNNIVRAFSGSYKLAAGETVDFAVGPGGNVSLHPGNTGLQAVILPLSNLRL